MTSVMLRTVTTVMLRAVGSLSTERVSDYIYFIVLYVLRGATQNFREFGYTTQTISTMNLRL